MAIGGTSLFGGRGSILRILPEPDLTARSLVERFGRVTAMAPHDDSAAVRH